MKPSSNRLLEAAKARLDNRYRKQSIPEIAEAIGVTQGWLQAFSKDRIAEPGVNKIVALYDYLGEPLDVRK